MQILRSFIKDEKGAELVTVALIAGIFVLIGVAAFAILRPYILDAFDTIGTGLTDAIN